MRRGQRTGILAGLLGWTVPLLLCAVFITLFISANPLMEIWLKRIDIIAILTQMASGRSLFWAVMLCLIWPLMRIASACGKLISSATAFWMVGLIVGLQGVMNKK
jgi:hypothetical protein